MRKKLFGFASILTLILLMSILMSVFSMKNVYATSGSGATYCDYTSIDWSSPDGGTYDGTTPYTYGSKVYDQNAVVTFNGTQPVYEKDLSKSDFTVKQHWYQKQYYKIYQNYHYVSQPGQTCTDTYTDYTGSNDYGTAPNISGIDTLSSSVLSLNTSGSKPNGTLTYTATYAGGSIDVDTYWVKSVSVTTGFSSNDIYIDDYSDKHTCKITYGNNKTVDCDQGTMDTTATNNLIASISAGQESNMSSHVNDNLTGFYSRNANNGPITNLLGYATRISDGALQQAQDNATGGFGGGPVPKNGMVGNFTAKFGYLEVYAYVDKFTGVSASTYLHAWHAAALDVEDETRSPQKKEVYAEQKVWDGGQEYRKDVLADVSCTVYYYGVMQPKDCKSQIDTPNEEYTDIATGYKHIDGTESLMLILGGRVPTTGNAYRYIKYHASYSDGTYILQDTDFRTILYATKVQTNDAYDSITNPNDYVPKTDDNYYTPEAVVTVLETYDKNKAIAHDYSAGHEGIAWHGYQETYDNFSYPSCTRSYAPSKITGAVLTEDCQSDEYYFYAGFSYDLGSNTSKPPSQENYYQYGNPTRTASIGYLENGLESHRDYLFRYVSSVDISISKQKTFQDEPYPNINCEKTYGAYDDGVVSGPAKSMSCLDKMFISNDTGQNSSMGGTRHVTFQYVNNSPVPTLTKPFYDAETMDRVYANSTIITPGSAALRTGDRLNFYSSVLWQDFSTKDISYLPRVWTSNVTGTGEEVDYIGDTWLNGYTDLKGDSHAPESINQWYSPDPISNDFHVNSTYPTNGPFNNGLSGWAFVGDTYAPASSYSPLHLYGINNISLRDNTDYVDEVDKDGNGNQLITSFPDLAATPWNGIKNPPNSGGLSPVLSFNNKTYQKSHFYNLYSKVVFDDGYVADDSSFPESSWRFDDFNGNWSYDKSIFPNAGFNGNFPYSGFDYRVLKDGYNKIRFDLFSEPGIRMPSNESNDIYQKTFSVANLWAHSGVDLTITGPTVVNDPKAIQSYRAYLNWNDGVGINQSGVSVGDNSNPWGQNKRTETSSLWWSNWWKDTNLQILPNPGNSYDTSFGEFPANSYYRTIASSYGNEHRTLPGFQYNEYFYSQISVLIYNNPGSACSSITVPTMGCKLPTDNGSNSNYRMPLNKNVAQNREIEGALKFSVTGVSTGSGE
jgi:hypothetical protein